MTLISAPAGFGKTTLLSGWIKQTTIPVCWISLDDDDNDPVRFLSYLVSALQTIDKEIGESIQPALRSPQPPASLTLLAYLISDVGDAIGKKEIALVLDDYHVIHQTAVHEIVDYLLKYLPLNFHLIISTRADPPLPLARMRARSELIELREADLRFSDEEAVEFFNQIKGQNLISSDISELNRRTEGWVTGLQMALLSLKGKGDKNKFIQSFTGSNRFVIDYLIEEVLDQQPERIRTLLLKTSILAEFSGDLCQALTGFEDSQAIVEKMERGNLFVIPLDDRREWYRYHHLFADLLYRRLSASMPESVKELHNKASTWFEENHYLGKAVEHALAANDFRKSLRLIGNYVTHIWEYGDQVNLTKWLSDFPEDVLLERPDIMAHHAFALCIAGFYDAAEEKINQIENSLEEIPKNIAGMLATVRAFYSLYRNEIKNAEVYSLSALENLAQDNHLCLSLAYSIHGDVHAFHGHFQICEEIWNKALHEAQVGDSVFMGLIASAKLIVARRRMGRLKDADATYHQQIERVSAGGYEQVAYAGALYAVWADILLEWNRLDEAVENIERGAFFFYDRQKYMAGLAWCAIAMVYARFSQGDIPSAEQALQTLEKRINSQNLPAWAECWYIAWKVRLAIAEGDLSEAEKCLKENNIRLDREFAYPHEVEYLALARLMIAKAKVRSKGDCIDQAEKLLLRLHRHLEDNGWFDKLIETEILLALTYKQQGREDKAIDQLEAALVMSEKEGYTRSYLNEGSPMANLLYKLVVRDRAVNAARRILSDFSLNETMISRIPKKDGLIDPLSTRELEVLQLIGNGASNREIGQILHIALGTVKNHIKSIYNKLNVHNRTQAVKRGRDLDLLQ